MNICDILPDAGRPVTLSIKLDCLGLKEALFLCYILERQDVVGQETHGWVCKSAEELQLETSLTYIQQKLARRHLLQKGLLQDRYHRLTHSMYYRVNLDALRAALEAASVTETRGQSVTEFLSQV